MAFMRCRSLKTNGCSTSMAVLLFAFAVQVLFSSYARALPIDKCARDNEMVLELNNGLLKGNTSLENNKGTVPPSRRGEISPETQKMILGTIVDAGAASNFPYLSEYLKSRYGQDGNKVNDNKLAKGYGDSSYDNCQRDRQRLNTVPQRESLIGLNGIQYPYGADYGGRGF